MSFYANNCLETGKCYRNLKAICSAETLGNDFQFFLGDSSIDLLDILKLRCTIFNVVEYQ